MKLGGITWWRFNYGSILQAYALQIFLNNYNSIDYEIICQYGKQVVSSKNLFDKLKRLGLYKTILRAIGKFGIRKLRNRNRIINEFITSHFRISSEEYDENNISKANDLYDGFICGSDQIWNPELVDLNSIYWLTFAESGKIKVAYAPSIGIDFFTDEQKEKIRNNLVDFKAVSTRENHSTALINDALGKDICVTVLDPTLIVDKEEWDVLSDGRPCQEPYIFAYMLRGTKRECIFIEEFAAKKNLKLVTMPFLDPDHIQLYDFKFGDYRIWDAGPEDFIRAIRYAEYVFTDSYHSIVFSCLYHINFFVFPKIGKAQVNRVIELLDMFNIKDRIIHDDFSVSKIDTIQKIDWSFVEDILAEKRMNSINYLKNALGV